MKRMLLFSMYGFSMFEASSAPSLPRPAPIMLCISSMYTMAFPSAAIPSMTSFILFSKSPLNWVPASIVLMSIW